MLRARRLKQIAESNQPAFTSTNGDHWWLADVPTRVEPVASVPSAKPVELMQTKPSEVTRPALAVSEVPASEPAEETEEPSYNYLQHSAPRESRKTASEEALTWDTNSCCFVMTA
jgi:hypothetical protein